MNESIGGASGGASIGFTAVASRPSGQRVERKVCEFCGGSFYRAAPEMAMLGEKYCAACSGKLRGQLTRENELRRAKR